MLSEVRRVLILAPHPDDEIVVCGIAAMRAIAAGARISVFQLTTGVPERGAFWPWQRSGHGARVRRRRGEAQRVSALLGMELAGGLDIPSRRLRFNFDNAANAVTAAIAASAAEALWVPAFEGGHQDHDAANALAAGFADRLPVWEFAAYNFAGGSIMANRFPNSRGDEIEIVANADEAERKRRALACYVSERGNLRHVGVTRETCRPLPMHDYGRPPHLGRLFRERFHWVPFRHPRIDFDLSAAVYRDIGIWRSAALDIGPGRETRQADREFAGAFDEP